MLYGLRIGVGNIFRVVGAANILELLYLVESRNRQPNVFLDYVQTFIEQMSVNI